MQSSPHARDRIHYAGTDVKEAEGVIIALHGRGASADDILSLASMIAPANWSLIGPAATGHSWYPYSFLAPTTRNEPFLSSALTLIQTIVRELDRAGIPAERIGICGFSQGACLGSEFVGRHPRRYAALLAFTGGLIGPLDTPLSLKGDLAGTPVLLSSGDPDPHVPWSRVAETATLFKEMGGRVTAQRHVGKPHTIAAEEIQAARAFLAKAAEPTAPKV